MIDNYTSSETCTSQNQSKKRVYTKKTTEKIRRWTKEESLSYEKFIEMHSDVFNNSNTKRVKKIFILMSKFIGTKAPSQCRSHHQKFYKKLFRKNSLNGKEPTTKKRKNESEKKEKSSSKKHELRPTLKAIEDFKKNFHEKPALIDEKEVMNIIKSRSDTASLSTMFERNPDFDTDPLSTLWNSSNQGVSDLLSDNDANPLNISRNLEGMNLESNINGGRKILPFDGNYNANNAQMEDNGFECLRKKSNADDINNYINWVFQNQNNNIIALAPQSPAQMPVPQTELINKGQEGFTLYCAF